MKTHLFTLMQREAQEVLHEGGSKVKEGGKRGSALRGWEGGQRGGWPNKVGKDLFPHFAKLWPP